MLELSDLQVFKTVVEEGGIVRAARKLNRVQSSVTMRVKALESSLNAQLFRRENQRLHLTASGLVLLEYANRLLSLSEAARVALADGAPRGLLRLGALESTTASRLPAFLAAYHKRYPDVRIELTTGTNDCLATMVADRRLDAAFVAEPPADKRLQHSPMFRERLVVISALSHPPIKRATDIDGLSIIAFPDGCAYRRVLQRWLGDRRMATARVLELASYHAIVACVAAGTGIALVPESVLETVQSAQVRKHPLPKNYSDRTTVLIWRTGEETAAMNALREVIQG